MIDWTDRHCRYLHRLLSRQTLLYTEMITAPALVRGGAVHLLDHDPAEHPVAVQLGGSDPEELAKATRLCADAGYQEVNLNVGCPSDRVQSGAFGAVLMKDVTLVTQCVSAMIAASPAEVTVKCRIGVDDQDPQQVLPEFLDRVSAAGVERFIIHARKAWLQGLSPRENREVPPLDYDLVYQMKKDFPHLSLSINGGISSLGQARKHLDAGLDGVMIGRSAYHTPANVLLQADQIIFDDSNPANNAHDVVQGMYSYIEAHLRAGGRLNQITRHMLGLFAGRPGARAWRRTLSDGSYKTGAGVELIEEALLSVARKD